MSDMARHVRTTIRYDGPALASHEMEVQDLAPALLALADIVQAANKKFNGDQADIKVLVNADVEQKCFMIDLSLAQSILDQAKGFFGSDGIKTAKEIAEWIGLIGSGAGGLFALLKWLRGPRKAEAPFSIERTTDGMVKITAGDSVLVIPPQTYQLAQDPAIVEKVKTVMKPLAKEGYESLAFYEGDREIFAVNDNEAAEIAELSATPLSDLPTESSSEIRGSVRIKSAQYEGGAQWSFLWNGRAISAEMVEQAAEWVADFQANNISAPPNSILDVSMTETVRLDTQGLAVGKPTYKVSQVHGVTPPPRQTNMFDDLR